MEPRAFRGDEKKSKSKAADRSVRSTRASGCESAPVGDLFQTFSAGVLEKSDFVAGMFEFVDVSPYFRLPRSLVRRGLAATGTASVKRDTLLRDIVLRSRRQVLQFRVS